MVTVILFVCYSLESEMLTLTPREAGGESGAPHIPRLTFESTPTPPKRGKKQKINYGSSVEEDLLRHQLEEPILVEVGVQTSVSR